MRPGFQRLQMVRSLQAAPSCSYSALQGASDCAYVNVRQMSLNPLSLVKVLRCAYQRAEMSAGRKSTDEVPDQDFSPGVSVSADFPRDELLIVSASPYWLLSESLTDGKRCQL